MDRDGDQDERLKDFLRFNACLGWSPEQTANPTTIWPALPGSGFRLHGSGCEIAETVALAYKPTVRRDCI
jgi:hypothetical protein